MFPWENGFARRASLQDIAKIAEAGGLTRAHLRAFMKVETPRGAFDDEGRPTILYERHIFWGYSSGATRAKAAREGLANRQGGDYGLYSAQYDKLQRAYAIDPHIALLSCSWGAGQIMGFNAETVGYANAEAMVEAFKDSEVKQIEAIVAYLFHVKLIEPLRAGNMDAVARGYNGKGYKKNNYAQRLKIALRECQLEEKRFALDDKTIIKRLTDLGVWNGEMTQSVKAFQQANGLKVDGIAGTLTRRALGI